MSWKAWALPWILQKLKKYAWETAAVMVNAGGHSIRVLNERSVRDGGSLRSVQNVDPLIWSPSETPFGPLLYPLLDPFPITSRPLLDYILLDPILDPLILDSLVEPLLGPFFTQKVLFLSIP